MKGAKGLYFGGEQRRPRPSLFRPLTSPSPWKLSVLKVPNDNGDGGDEAL